MIWRMGGAFICSCPSCICAKWAITIPEQDIARYVILYTPTQNAQDLAAAIWIDYKLAIKLRPNNKHSTKPRLRYEESVYEMNRNIEYCH